MQPRMATAAILAASGELDVRGLEQDLLGQGGRSSDPRHRFCGDYHNFLLELGVSESERKKERGTNTSHVRSTQPSDHRTDSSSRHGMNVVEINRAVSRQAVRLRERDLCWNLTDSHAIRSTVSVYPVCCEYSCATTSMDRSAGPVEQLPRRPVCCNCLTASVTAR